MTKSRKPEEVFTPRAPTLNERMYIPRQDLEESLRRALQGNKHVIVHGESGSGKSWLYKRVATSQDAAILIADLANASRFKSITTEFENLVNRAERAVKTGFVEEKSATGGIPLLSAELKHAGSYELTSKEPFEKCLEHLRKSAGKKLAILVWDNFERLLGNKELVAEAADLIALADNPDYAAYNVKIIIVGVPSDIRSYIAATEYANTISNRLVEIPEVERLTQAQALDLIKRGFCDELGYKFDKGLLDRIAEHVCWVTDRIPQHLHEYCLELANIGESHGSQIDVCDLDRADELWLESSLVSVYTVVESHMNARNTEAGRRNQTIYSIGAYSGQDFTYTDIEDQMRFEFPQSTHGKGLNVSQLLVALAGGDSPLIKQTPKGNAYRLVNPKLRMCIRTMLTKDDTGERVVKRSFQVG